MKTLTAVSKKQLPASSAVHLKENLNKALETIPPFSECCAAGFPEGDDVGEHMMWLGMMLWIRQERNSRLRYAAGVKNFHSWSFQRLSGAGPILFSGGILGDCAEDRLRFCERIIKACPDRPVFILPQTLHFYNSRRLAETRSIFNGHPNLSLFVRDKPSLILAQEHFGDCEIHQACDMSLELADHFSFLKALKPKRPLLIHRRAATRKGPDLLAEEVGPAADYDDWEPLLRQSGARHLLGQAWKPLRQGLLKQGAADLPEFQRFASVLSKELPLRTLHFRSLEILIRGIRQMMTYRYVITNRLHGHLLCLMLGKPHLLLADELTRNEEFFRLWTASNSESGPRQKR